MMNYLLFIGFVNRHDLLERAVRSIEPLWRHTSIVDNSEQRTLRTSPLASCVNIIEPPVPLSLSQTMNLLKRKGETNHCDVMMFMHNDAEMPPGMAELFLKKVEQLSQSNVNWGTAIPRCDALTAFNVKAMTEVGLWDTYLPKYFADGDYYRRLNLAGYPQINTEVPIMHHNSGASTVKSDASLAAVHNATFSQYLRYYVVKWGGEPGQEAYTAPFNRS
ncbi:glycosyltransferase family 2 protein [Paenibacillus larvae]|uniref:glycosyltransferase family 2 protein n=1 Tax=Paenibacillus larvae TaxID=1464 RepID=UPI002282B057|nr:glycosyltransferase family 2 protein [Paenibacillus larvae]MCY9511505.1 glycosyltransferase family 2 protein [Paenibacillus larvae]MCY9526524.1 glycosyltransferase family 2 protein [Paenibacillus larvae]